MADNKASEELFGGPTKRFFVSMLTRDIELADAILDLIDNCVDGAMRTNRGQDKGFEAFVGYEARLSLSKDHFLLDDNCGGIPEDYLSDAFHLGRPKVDKDDDLPTIGMFGIGMKRAIFKMAQEALVVSNTADAENTVSYSAKWLDPDNDDWMLPVARADSKDGKHGVSIRIDKLKPEIGKTFEGEAFIEDLKSKISLHFGYIMQRGFEIYFNDQKLRPSTLPLLSADYVAGEKALLPFDFEMSADGVDTKVTVGFFRRLVREEEIDEQAQGVTDTDVAGISVICNDRVVLLHDKSMATGWGDGGAPRYHPQFRAIAGLITISSADPSKLPLSTTKRGLDGTSEVYLVARGQCIDGIQTFTSFTNRWKGIERDANEVFDTAKKTDARTQVSLARNHGSRVRNLEGAVRFRPDLPVPNVGLKKRRISFQKPVEDVETLSNFFFDEADIKPSVVGEEAFDRLLKEARDAER